MAAGKQGVRPRASPARTSCSPAASRCCTSSAAAAPDHARRRGRRASAPALSALVGHVRRGAIKRLGLERVDGEGALTSPLGPALLELGFQEGPRRLTLSA